ncbi:unnamed protein product [Ectocarpus fasciculatus]
MSTNRFNSCVTSRCQRSTCFAQSQHSSRSVSQIMSLRVATKVGFMHEQNKTITQDEHKTTTTRKRRKYIRKRYYSFAQIIHGQLSNTQSTEEQLAYSVQRDTRNTFPMIIRAGHDTRYPTRTRMTRTRKVGETRQRGLKPKQRRTTAANHKQQ